MKELSRKSFFDTKRAAFFLFVLLANVALVFPIRYSRMVWILPLAVFLDFWLAFRIKRLLTPMKEQKRISESVSPLLDELRFAIPTNQEIYIEPIPATVEETPDASIIETDGAIPQQEGMLEKGIESVVRLDSTMESDLSEPLTIAPNEDTIDDTEFPSKSISKDGSETAFETKLECAFAEPKRVIPSVPEYDKPILPSAYSDELTLHLSNYGFAIDKNLIREWFAAMAASKLIVVQGEDSAIMHRLFELTADFLGATLAWEDPLTVPTTENDALIHDIPMVELCLKAHQEPKLLHFCGIRNVDSAVLETTYRDLMDYSLNPLFPHHLTNDSDQPNVEIPHNLWFFVFLNTKDGTTLSNSLMQSASLIEWSAKLVDPLEEVRQNPLKLSQEAFAHLLLDSYERHFFDESDWKKIDQIERFASLHSPFSLDNRIVRQLERYASAYLLFGGDKTDAIDSILYLKLLRLVELATQTEATKSEEDILSICERLYGLEHLPRSKPLLKRMISIQKPQS